MSGRRTHLEILGKHIHVLQLHRMLLLTMITRLRLRSLVDQTKQEKLEIQEVGEKNEAAVEHQHAMRTPRVLLVVTRQEHELFHIRVEYTHCVVLIGHCQSLR